MSNRVAPHRHHVLHDPPQADQEEWDMKVLIATKRTQGAMPGDYSWALEGELVTPISMACSSPDSCGCGRGFPGLASARATTTALVVERPEVDDNRLRDALRDSLDRQGWLQHLDADQADDVVDDHVDSIERVCEHFEVGAVLGRYHSSVFIRALTTV
jgi:hypothetical protein